jgi:gas vesicle protein
MFIVGALVGALGGAAIGLLLAPRSGEETREQVRRKAVEMQGEAEETLGEARAWAESVAADIRRRAKELQAQSQAILDEGQKQLVKAVEETKRATATTASHKTEMVKRPEELPAVE